MLQSKEEAWDDGDEVARQRRRREARVLDGQLFDSPELTLADVVADVLAESSAAPGPFDVRGYLTAGGHHWRTIEAVTAFLEDHGVDVPPPSRQLP